MRFDARQAGGRREGKRERGICMKKRARQNVT
jgi:hypothetical protein